MSTHLYKLEKGRLITPPVTLEEIQTKVVDGKETEIQTTILGFYEKPDEQLKRGWKPLKLTQRPETAGGYYTEKYVDTITPPPENITELTNEALITMGYCITQDWEFNPLPSPPVEPIKLSQERILELAEEQSMSDHLLDLLTQSPKVYLWWNSVSAVDTEHSVFLGIKPQIESMLQACGITWETFILRTKI